MGIESKRQHLDHHGGCYWYPIADHHIGYEDDDRWAYGLDNQGPRLADSEAEAIDALELMIAENCGNVIPPTSKFCAYWWAIWSG